MVAVGLNGCSGADCLGCESCGACASGTGQKSYWVAALDWQGSSGSWSDVPGSSCPGCADISEFVWECVFTKSTDITGGKVCFFVSSGIDIAFYRATGNCCASGTSGKRYLAAQLQLNGPTGDAQVWFYVCDSPSPVLDANGAIDGTGNVHASLWAIFRRQSGDPPFDTETEGDDTRFDCGLLNEHEIKADIDGLGNCCTHDSTFPASVHGTARVILYDAEP